MHGRRKSLIIFVIVFLPVVLSQIPLSSKLSVEAKNHWVSPNGDFAIWFFDRLNLYGIGIRINTRLVPVEKQPVVLHPQKIWGRLLLRVGDGSLSLISLRRLRETKLNRYQVQLWNIQSKTEHKEAKFN